MSPACPAALVLLATSLLAPPAAGQVRLALTAGVASTTFEQEEAGIHQEVDRRIGPTAGVSARWPFAAGFSLATGLGYVSKGGGDPASDATLRLRYVAAPVLVRHDLDPERRFAPFVAAGLVVGYLAGCTLDNGAGHVEGCDTAFGPDDSYGRWDLGAALATGIRAGTFALTVQREIGLRDIDRSATFETRNRAWLVMLSVGL